MKLKDLLKGIGYIKIVGTGDIEIGDMYYDSRRVTADSLFFCIKGLTVDGHNYAAQAVERGAKALVLERDVNTTEDITKVFVRDSKVAMANIAKNYYKDPTQGITFIGVTGTNGKTTITHLVKAVLEEIGQRVGLIGTITNMIGDRKIPSAHTTPESLDLQRLLREMADENADSIVMEVSSHSLSLGRVEGCQYDIGAFTNLSRDHLDFHPTMEEYRDAKAKLFAQSKMAVINVDDESGRWIKDRFEGRVMTYGICKEADIYARDLEITDKGVTFNLHSPEGEIPINLAIPGIFSIYNALAAAGICLDMGISLEAIAQGLQRVKGIDGRFELLDTGTDYSVILDYAHTPDGLENILETARGFVKGRVLTLFGCGGDRDFTKRPMMGEVAGRFSDLCIITSDNPRSEEPMKIIKQIMPGVKKTGCPYKIIENRKEAIEYALSNAKKGDVVILAGKGHETYQILKNKTIHFDEKEIVMEILGRERP
ncbi:MAG: UDP-N-acetylmuramoyl-L-alanyl-D-glutamate--2,6-diaminopimelate ligase [Clostridiales bacterium]|nr:UDP-N-acetylmuramoyl-L-alanyl-D-glutamate--2,6-diaminopimelate ligase [Clostridiales bacterium]